MTLPAVIGNGLAWFLVCLFAQAAVHKLGAPRYCRELMRHYVGAVGGGLAVWLCTLEAGIALSLLVPQWRAAGSPAAASLLLVLRRPDVAPGTAW